MNNVNLLGRLTRDPEVRYNQDMCIARFTLAVDRRVKKDNEANADFISCIAFGKTAQFAEKYLHQGIKIAVSGRIQTGSYTKQDGTKVYTTDVIAEQMEFAESKQAQPVAQPQGYAYPQQVQAQTTPAYVQVNGYVDSPNMVQPTVTGAVGYQNQPYVQQSMQEGFMQIPDELNDEGLPFG